MASVKGLTLQLNVLHMRCNWYFRAVESVCKVIHSVSAVLPAYLVTVIQLQGLYSS